MRRIVGLRRVAACLALVVACATSAVLAQWLDEKPSIMRVQVTDKERQIPQLAEMGLDLAGIDTKAGTVDFVGDGDAFRKLRDAGFDPVVVWTSADVSLQALSDYLDPTEIGQRLDSYQTAYPALAKRIQIATTENGRPEWALKISDNVNVEEDEPVVLYIGQHHAREVMTTEITLDIIDYLLTRYATDAQVRAWVDGREIWVVASHNPDGANSVFTGDNLWRKNRRNNGNGTFGVDPNRNYAFHWNLCGGSSGTTSSDTYRGPSAGSEPETQGLMQLAQTHRPALSLSYHTYSELVIIPYGCTGSYTSENRKFRDLSSDVAVRIRNDANDGWYQPGTGWELLYAVDGDSDGGLYGDLGTAAITIEANSQTQGFQPDYATWRTSTVTRNRSGWQFLLDRLDGPTISGHTTDACSGSPITASLALDEIAFAGGEATRTSEPGYGRFDWIVSPGSWHLNVSRAGYRTQDWPVEVGFRAARRDVRLVPTGSFGADVFSKQIQDPTGDGDAQTDPGETVTMPVTVLATGGALSGLTATLSSADSHVTITDATGSWPAIGAGGAAASSDSFAFTVAGGTPDGYVIPFTLTFAADQALCGPAAGFEVRVTTGAPICPAVSAPLDANPGWTIQNSEPLGWAFGPPGTTGGARGGPPSPHSGTNVYGTNLSGSYGNNADDRLTTTAFDLSDLKNTELRFWRWLNNEEGYDLASVAISTDGTNFTTVWSGFGYDTQWELYRIDISSLADRQPTVYVRFRLQSDSSLTYSGFYVDDVSICGETLSPAPSLAVTSWTVDDGENPGCSDHDGRADGGETIALDVSFQNLGAATVSGATARISSTDPRIVLIDFDAPLGSIPPGGTASATYRFKVADAAACVEQAPFRIDFGGNAGTYLASDTTIALTLQVDDGTPVPDTFENFETAGAWTLTGEWQIGAPMGKGGSAGGGNGNPDPTLAYSGTKVLGIDLTGDGTYQGNYENNLTAGITATSPVYDCTNADNVQLQFKRWLGVERYFYDHATAEVWNGSTWQTVYQNPDTSFSDSAWQSVSYDVSAYADGNPAFQVRFKMTSDSSVVYCGWNIDDLHLTNGYVPQACESGVCAAGCSPASEIGSVALTRSGATQTLAWSASGDPCHETAYRVYRSASAAPRVPSPSQWPADSFFADVTALDADGLASNPSFTDAALPPAGGVLFYLVVDVGTNGSEGPKGWQGL